MSLIDQIIKGKRITADFLYDLAYGLANGDLDTTNNNLPFWRNKVFYDHVVEGCVWTADAAGSTRYGSMTAGVVHINGKVVTVDAIPNRLFTASKDTYHFVDDSGASIFSEVSNNATSPTAPSNSILVGIIVTGASSIAAASSINQGSPTATLPLVSSQYLQCCDTNGVPIYNTNPIELTFIRKGTSSPTPNVEADVSGATCTFTLAKTAKVYIDLWAHTQLNSGATRDAYWKLYIDGVAATQIFHRDNPGATETHIDGYKPYDTVLAAGAHTIKIRSVASAAGVVACDGGFRARIREA